MANVVQTIVRTDDEVNLDPIKKKYDAFASGLARDLETQGTKAGTKFVSGIAAGMEKANSRVIRANEMQARSVRALQVAQERLAEVQQNATAKKSARLAAEAAFANALDDVAAATRRVTEAEEAREAVRKSVTGGTTKHTVDFDMKSSLSRIKSQAITELASAGIAGGSAFAGGLAAGMSPVAAAGFFVALAAMAQSSNQQVRAKFADLWENVKSGAQEASAETADEFIGLAEQLGRTFNAIKPELAEGMAEAAPMVTAFGDGLDRLAKTAMPGVVAATKEMGQQADSMGDLMESSGRAVSNFFMESKEGAEQGGEAMEAFGRIVERLGTFAGRTVADLSNISGDAVPQLENALDSAMDTAENFIQTIGPGLASGAAMGFSGLSVLLQLVNGIITVLGPAAGPLLSFAAGLKALDMITFGGVKGQWDSFMGSIRNAEGPMSKTRTGLAGILTTLGPVGLAAGGLTLGLGYLADKQAEAAARAEKHRNAIKSLASEFERTGGTVDSAIRKMVGDRIVNDFSDAKNAAGELGISLGDLTTAALKQGTSYDELHNRLTKLREEHLKWVQENTAYEQGDMGQGPDKKLENLNKTIAALEALGAETDAARARERELADAMGEASGRTNTLAEEFGTLADKTSSAEQKAQALYEILRRMAGGAPEVEEATRQWEEFVDTFNSKEMNFDDKAAGTQKWADALVNVNGQINLTTEDGRKLYDTVTGMAQAFQDTAVSMQANGESAEAIRGRLQTMRDQFVDAADKMGFTRTQAEALANQYGLIPDDVSTLIHSNLAPEIQKAIDLGGKIRSLPNGSFVVTANTQHASGAVEKFIQQNDGRVIRIVVQTVGNNQVVTNTSSKSHRQHQASGGPTRGGIQAASGGARTGVIWTNEGGRQESIITPDRTEMAIPITAPVGSQIRPHAGNNFLNGGSVMPILGEVTIVDDGSDVAKFVGMLVRKYVKFKGGNVQKALGQTG